MSKLVTLMLPTRGRFESFSRSMASLRDTASDFSDVEVLARIDDDEADPDRYAKLVSNLIVGPRGRGYADLHLMYNEMCAKAQGRFLFLWNDDAVMLGKNWDDELRRFDNGKLCYIMTTLSDKRGKHQRNNYFPIVHRSYYDELGHFSLSAHNDTYIWEAMKDLPVMWESNIHIMHNALTLIAENDQTSKEAMACWPETKSTWVKPEVQVPLATDKAKLRELYKRQKT